MRTFRPFRATRRGASHLSPSLELKRAPGKPRLRKSSWEERRERPCPLKRHVVIIFFQVTFIGRSPYRGRCTRLRCGPRSLRRPLPPRARNAISEFYRAPGPIRCNIDGASREGLAGSTASTSYVHYYCSVMRRYDETHPFGVGGDREEMFRHSAIHTRGQSRSKRYRDHRAVTRRVR